MVHRLPLQNIARRVTRELMCVEKWNFLISLLCMVKHYIVFPSASKEREGREMKFNFKSTLPSICRSIT